MAKPSPKSIKKQKLPKGFKEFLIKTSIFIILFILIQLLTMGIVAKTFLPGDIKLFAMDDLAEASLFVLVIFFALNKEKLLKVKQYSVKINERLFSALLIMVIFPLYFKYKVYMIANIELVKQYLYCFTFIEYLILFTILLFLLSLVYGFKFIKDFFKEYKKGLGFVLIGIIAVYISIREFQKLWPYLSHFVGSSVNYLLNFIAPSKIYFVKELPVLIFNNFSVSIAQTCSGIDSILLFTGLYLGLLAWDWKILNKKKAIAMFIPGVIGAFLLNIIRIFLLVLIGAYISESFALHSFHTNAASILFLIYFAAFWSIFYKWMKK